jgi:SAM-dependent methyltransferase
MTMLGSAVRRYSYCLWINRQIRLDLRSVADLCHGTLLDLGCGNKPYRDIFARHVSRHVGLDSPTGYHGQASEADLWSDASALALRDESVDVVLCTQVLEHVPEPRQTVLEAARVLKKGGILIMTVPLMNVVHEAPHDYFRFTPYALELLLAQASLSVVCIRNQGGGWAMLGQNVAWRVAALGHARGKVGQVGGLLLAQAAALPFFVMERFDKRAAFHEGVGYLAVARKPD